MIAHFFNPQILLITCDNASANDTMITHLTKILDAFPGSANHTCCFAHILNLVAKCIMKQFDTPKKPQKKRKNKLSFKAELDVLEDELSEDNDLDGEIKNEKDEGGNDTDEGHDDDNDQMDMRIWQQRRLRSWSRV